MNEIINRRRKRRSRRRRSTRKETLRNDGNEWKPKRNSNNANANTNTNNANCTHSAQKNSFKSHQKRFLLTVVLDVRQRYFASPKFRCFVGFVVFCWFLFGFFFYYSLFTPFSKPFVLPTIVEHTIFRWCSLGAQCEAFQ